MDKARAFLTGRRILWPTGVLLVAVLATVALIAQRSPDGGGGVAQRSPDGASGVAQRSPDAASSAPQPSPTPTRGTTMSSHPYVGLWVTADNHIRQELLPDGRYDEARGDRASAYTGRYWVTGNRIEYKDDTGFSADGRFDGDVLHHGGYVFYREGSPAHRSATR